MDYIIGAGAILESGENGSITPATLHAYVGEMLGERVRAAAIDFEGTSPAGMRRLLVVATGWNCAAFRTRVTVALREQETCTLADVLRTLARGAQTSEVHLFAHWLPDDETCTQLRQAGIDIIAHPLESIEAAAIVAGQRHRRWRAA